MKSAREPRPRGAGARSADGRPAEARDDDVFLGSDWVASWLPRLGGDELRAYVALSHAVLTRPYLNDQELAVAFRHDGTGPHGAGPRGTGPPGGGPPGRGLEGGDGVPGALDLVHKLERRGLLELVTRRGRHHIHLRCRGADGIHRAGPARPSIKEAIAFQKRMMEELIATASADETPQLREQVFHRYPELREAYDASLATGDGTRPRWRLWLELSLFLMGRFEERYGELRTDHAEVFKEIRAQLLRLKLEVLEQVTQELLQHREELFPAHGTGWIGGLDEASFVALPRVRSLARKYRVGMEQLFLHAMETLQQRGLAIVHLDAHGNARDLELPSTTGLAPEEERYLFLPPDELDGREAGAVGGRQDADDASDPRSSLRARVRQARERYREHLLEVGVSVLCDLQEKSRLPDPDALMSITADRVNDAIDLVQPPGGAPDALLPVTREELGGRFVARGPRPEVVAE